MTVTAVPSVAANWWLFLVMGLVSTIAGLLALVYPDLTLLALGIFAGVSLLFIGALELADAIAGGADGRALSAIMGVLSILAGLVCLRRPGESLLAIVVVLGIYLVIAGIVRFVRSFSELEERAALIGLAIIDVILGVLILSLPKLSLATLAVLFAISLIARGIYGIVTGFRMRSLGHGSEPGATAPA